MEPAERHPNTTRRRPTRVPAPTVEQARAFCAAVTSSNYREAAAALGIPETSHRTVMRLVDRFGTSTGAKRLIAGSPRGDIVVTPEGQAIYDAAKQFLDAADGLVRAAREGARVRFSTYPAIATRLALVAPEIIEGPDALDLYDISDRNRADGGRQLVERTVNGEIDICVAPRGLSGPISRVRELELYTWRLRIVLPAGHPLRDQARQQISPRQLVRERLRLVAAPKPHLSRQLLEKAFHAEGAPITITLESSDQPLLRAIAEGSATLAAALPDDMGGAPNVGLGPALVAGGQELGGTYSVYTRRGDTPRDEEIKRIVAKLRAHLRDRTTGA